MRRMHRSWSRVILMACAAFAGSPAARAEVPLLRHTVVHAYPHDVSAFTEGLLYRDGVLYESTGENGKSTLRKVDLKSGKVLQKHDLSTLYFGEGIVDWKDTLIQLTWRNGVGFVHDLNTFDVTSTFHYRGEGWGLTRDSTHIYMSDGSSALRILDPDSLEQTGRLEVTADGRPVHNLNELEWVNGTLYANVWMTSRIAIIDPASGKVTGWLDLADLLDVSALPDPADSLLNGIAYDAKKDRLFVTGKRWPMLFEIKVVAPPTR